MDMFDSPASGVKITTFEGELLLVAPKEFKEGVLTSFGPADYVEADVTVLDGQHKGEHHGAVRMFQKQLIGQLRPKVGTGRMVLGRLGRGEAKAGQSAPWVLKDPTEDDKNKARQHLDAAKAAEDRPPF